MRKLKVRTRRNIITALLGIGMLVTIVVVLLPTFYVPTGNVPLRVFESARRRDIKLILAAVNRDSKAKAKIESLQQRGYNLNEAVTAVLAAEGWGAEERSARPLLKSNKRRRMALVDVHGRPYALARKKGGEIVLDE